MAYAALVSLAQTIDIILNYHQDFIYPQLEDGAISIRKCVNDILEEFPEEFPEKASSLEGRMREAAHAAEDVIEFLLSDLIHESKDAVEGGSREQLPFRCAGNPGSEHQTWKKYRHLRCDLHNLNKVTEEIELITERIMEIKNSIADKDVGLDDSAAATSSSTVAAAHRDVMLGCDKDLLEIKSRLCGDSSKLEVIPIVGMGGIGKTTLARNVYDDLLTVENYDIRVWIIVSQNYSVQEIISNLLVSMKFDANDDSVKAHHVYQNLMGRRYLIVLDDLWSVKAWDDLKMMFPDDGNGSRIMITTRLSDVATYPDSYSPVHEMRLMDEDQSWNLLRQKVFKQDPCPYELEVVGKKIVKSCRGLPLAIVVISGLLIVDQTKAAWENIARDVKSAISSNDEQFDNILSLSYTRLPHQLRPCFLYIGGFKEDYEICVSKLIKLWVAEGFIKPNGYYKSFEETAEAYLEDLVKRSLVLVTKRKSNGRIKIVGMHDLMRDMCIRKAQEENFILQLFEFLDEGAEIPRRLSNFRGNLDFPVNFCGSTIRTIVNRNPTTEFGSPCCLGQFRLLRILDLLEADDCFHQQLADRSLPAEVYELFHIRYLALNPIFIVGAAISNLQNLQTLIIKDAIPDYKKPILLPLEIWRLPQLKHLVVCYGRLLPPLSFEEGAVLALENLQTLSIARDFFCALKVLKMIPNLKKLGLCYVRSKETYGDYQLYNLIHLLQLEKLKLEMYEFPYMQKVNLAFPRTLKKLTLSHLRLPWKDMKMVGSLPNLEVLKLRNRAFVGHRWETTEGEFSQLIFLSIDKLDLQDWITESSHFPKLKCLALCDCQDLREIPDGIGEIPTLELIKLVDVTESILNSAKQIKDDQHSNGNYSLRISHVTGWVDVTIDLGDDDQVRILNVDDSQMEEII